MPLANQPRSAAQKAADKRYKAKMTRITVELPHAEADELKAAAEDRGLTLTRLVKDVLAAFLAAF